MSQPLIAQGEFALINQHLAAAMQKPPIGWNPVGEHTILVLMADTAAAQRDARALRDTAGRANEISRQIGHRLYQGISLRALGMLARLEGDSPGARERLLAALEIFQTLETRWQAGRTWVDLAELLAAQGRGAEAAGHYARAIGEFEALGAKPLVEQARAALAGLARA